ncbi:HVM61 protein, partial [Amia calva]|nr:HVM61 protein [Amia calva]
MVGKPGQSLTISCTVSGYSLTDTSYAALWIRQAPGKTFELLGGIHHSLGANLDPSFEGQMTITKTDSTSTVFLQIKSLKEEDTAVYYCARGSGR